MSQTNIPDPKGIDAASRSAFAVFLIFLRLGLSSFGGPIAHLSYFREEFVARRQWLREQSYADLVSLCQFLPGPASSQIGIAIGLLRCGYRGAFAAWLGFTLPSAIAMILFALGMSHFANRIPEPVLHGLKLVAVAVVAQAVWNMARNLCAGKTRIALMALACCLALQSTHVWTPIAIILCAGLGGLLFLKTTSTTNDDALIVNIRRRTGLCWLGLFFFLLLALPLLLRFSPHLPLAQFDAFYRAGALVFGGGHVVLPLLQTQLVPAGWINNDVFLAGYGLAQALPGPLFTFAAFLGASSQVGFSGWAGGIWCLLAIFLPSFLLVAGALPFWEQLRRNQQAQAALSGVNAAVVGLLLAALYHPVWISAIFRVSDVAQSMLALVALMVWRIPPWLVVIASGLLAWLISLSGL
jgi:chromate transporter